MRDDGLGAFFLLRDDTSETERQVEGARNVLVRRGFSAFRARRCSGWRLLHADPIGGGAPDAFLVEGDDFVAVAGMPVVGGAIGAPALRRLLRDVALPALDRSRIDGHFAAVVHRDGRTWVFNDHLGAFQVYHDDRDRLFSTSFLAATATLPRVTLDAQGVYEYAFNVAPVGDDTVVAELKTLGPERVVALSPGASVSHAVRGDAAIPVPPGDVLARNAALLVDAAKVRVAHFGDAIHVPLTGGIDSRLALATLRACGARPNVYVYGPAGSPDVEIARAIGVAEGFAVACIDRAALVRDDPRPFAERVRETWDRTDGLPNFGNIFDGGASLAAQVARHPPGHLAVSGGGGEVYRDFFRLPDRPCAIDAVASAFFSRFVAADATVRFDPAAFLWRIGAKLAAAVGAAESCDVVPRDVIERLYPRVRCRALFGRELTIEAGYGSYYLPFLEQAIVQEGAMLPMAAKQTGGFEAALVAAIDPALARHPSAYGHGFLDRPGARYRANEWLSRRKPLWLRRYSYALQRRMRPSIGNEHGGADELAAAGEVLDMGLPIMREYFDVARIGADRGLWYRVACLEYFAGRVGAA